MATAAEIQRAYEAKMNLFLEQVSQTFSKYFIVMQVDQADWHSAKDLAIASEYPPDPSACLQSRAESG